MDDPSGCAVQDQYGLGPVEHWNHGFESRSRQQPFPFLCCPVQVEALRWADPPSKETSQNV